MVPAFFGGPGPTPRAACGDGLWSAVTSPTSGLFEAEESYFKEIRAEPYVSLSYLLAKEYVELYPNFPKFGEPHTGRFPHFGPL